MAEFVAQNFDEANTEFEPWDPEDWRPDPEILDKIEVGNCSCFPFAIYEPQNPLMDVIHVAGICRSTDIEALKLSKAQWEIALEKT